MRRSLYAEMLKLGKRPAVHTTIGVWLVLSLFFGYVFPYFTYRGSSAAAAEERAAAIAGVLDALPASLATTPIAGLPVFAGALAILFGALATGSEYGWRTMKIVLSQGPPRTSVIAGKLAALVLLLASILVLSFATAAVASAIVEGATELPTAWPSAGAVLAGLGSGLLIAAMWCSAGVLLAHLLRGTAMPIGLGLVWALAVENLLRTGASIPVLGTLQRYTPGSAAGSLVAALDATPQSAGGTPGVSTNLPGLTAAAVLLVYLAVFVIATVLVVRRRDVN
ncbi:hypothetical protein GCM10029976_031260 [Kribbella albertanoniae]|uniref:ABC transporter permease n=1 Tax=Kribbella albertanoniae TaxID=1266829 RepID=A0A4R4QHD7_9ACTN|nr:ABC transporter permease subunit [Kribbella albertanoniae]TDC35048.1 ABC transporter permease [Kribbella albertanoniae]